MNQEQGNHTPNATSATGTSENFSSATPSQTSQMTTADGPMKH